MTGPGTTKTTTIGADGKPTSTQLVEASTQQQAQTVGGTASGTLGAAIAAANFVYSIIKDHGAKLDVTVETGGEGVASGTFDDTRFKSKHAGEFTASGVWYTHTRAYGSLLDRNRGDLKHDKTKTAAEFGSVYLCTVFPYQLRWNLYEVAPKPISDLEVARKAAELAKSENAAHQTFNEQTEDLGLADGALKVRDPVKKDKWVSFRRKLSQETFDDYLEFLDKFKDNEPALRTAVAELKASLGAIAADRKAHETAVADSRKGDVFYVLRNVTIQVLTDHQGIRQRFWQHVSVKSKFTITPRPEKPYGFRVALTWGESALGYGYPGAAGDFEVTQDGPAAGDVKVLGDSKVGRRFTQFSVVGKVR